MRIGFIGLGTMGKNPATNTLTQATQAPFSEAGKRYGMSAGETTLCNVIEDDAGIDLRLAGDWVKPWDVAPHINAPPHPPFILVQVLHRRSGGCETLQDAARRQRAF